MALANVKHPSTNRSLIHMSKRRSRGRPPGTGKNDAPYLARIADAVLANPKLAPTTAMRQLIAECNDWLETDTTLLRRWQIKWKASAEQLMQAARSQAARSKAMPKTPDPGGGGYILLQHSIMSCTSSNGCAI